VFFRFLVTVVVFSGHGVRTRSLVHLFLCTFYFLLLRLLLPSFAHFTSFSCTFYTLLSCTLHASSFFTFRYITFTLNTSGIPSPFSPILITRLPPPFPTHARSLPMLAFTPPSTSPPSPSVFLLPLPLALSSALHLLTSTHPNPPFVPRSDQSQK